MTWKVATAKKGQRSPPPLPMYERVVLKHVPTMVRRRYDRDLNIIDENNQGKSEDDEVDEDLDDSFDDYEEAEGDTHVSLDNEYDSQSCRENFGSNDIESSSSSCSKDCDDGNGAKDEGLVEYVEASVGNESHENEHDFKSEGEGAEDANISVQSELQDIEHENFDDKQDSKERKEEDDEANNHVTVVANNVDAIDVQDIIGQGDGKSEGDESEDNQSLASDYKDGSVQDGVQGNQHVNFDNQRGSSCIEHCHQSEGDGFKDVNGASYFVDENLSNDAQDKEQENFDENKNENDFKLSFGKDSPSPLPMYERVLLKHVPTIVRRRYDKDINKFDANPGLSEDVKSEGASSDDENSGDDEACTKATLDTVNDTSEDFGSSTTTIHSEEIKSEDGVEYSCNVSCIDASAENKIQVLESAKSDLNYQGLSSKDVEEDVTTRDVNLASDVDASIKTEPEYNEQGLNMEHCKNDVGGTKDHAIAVDIHKRDTSVENESKHNEHGNDVNKQGSCSKDVEGEDDGAKDASLENDVDASVKNEAELDEQGLHVEDCKSEGHGAKDVNNVASLPSYHLDESVQHNELLKKDHSNVSKEHENLDNKQGLHKGNCERGGDGSKNTNVFICNKNVSTQEVWDKDHGHFGSKQDTTIALFGNRFKNLMFSDPPSCFARLIQVKWNPPPINSHIFTFDGSSCSTPSLVVMGIVIRDSHGSILSARAYKMELTTLDVAEAMAIRKGLLQLGLSNPYVEGGKQLIIIRSIHRDYRSPWNLQFLVDDLKHLHG